jgi:hypothetical protein
VPPPAPHHDGEEGSVLDERDHEMRRTFGALFAAGVLVTILAGTTSAAPKPKPAPATSSLTMTVCVDSQNEMRFHLDWANEAADPNQDLTVTLTLQGGGRTTQVTFTNARVIDPTSYTDTTSSAVVGPKGPIDWNHWRTIGATASGAFTDATAIRRPGGSWPAC